MVFQDFEMGRLKIIGVHSKCSQESDLFDFHLNFIITSVGLASQPNFSNHCFSLYFSLLCT